MKIEMGESLLYSYLRHCCGCQIVQTNWKTSPVWTVNNADQIQDLMTQIDDFFQKKYNYNIFKKNKSVSQIMRQAEIDGIGYQPGNIYLVEMAFHSQGLNYHGKEETTRRIISKMSKAAFVDLAFFGNQQAKIIFASPQIYPGPLELLLSAVEDLQKIVEKNNLNCELELLYNESFKEEILDNVLINANAVADEAELFLRAYKLLDMFNKGV